MEKIPVGATIAHAYSFAFGRFFTLLGIMWLPYAIMMAAWLPLMRQITSFSAAVTSRNFATLGATMAVMALVYILMLLLILMQMTGLTQEALGQRRGSRFFYFNLGQPLWALVLSMVLLMLAFLALVFVTVFVIATVAGFARGLGGAGGGAVILIMSLALYCAFLYVTTRLSFLAIPVAVAENRISLKRAWALGRGNFWRMFVILLAVVLPVLVLMAVLMFAFLFQGMPPFPPAGADPTQLAEYRQAVAAWQASMISREMGYWYIVVPVGFILSVIFYGLIAGAQAFAYRALMPDHNVADTFG